MHVINPIEDLKIHYKRYNAEVDPIRKISNALSFVTTPYVVLNGDDDFLVPSTLSRAVDFLQTHSDYSVVHGEASTFCLKLDSVWGQISSMDRYDQRRIIQQSGVERLVDHFTHYSTTFYSVHHTQQLRENYQKAPSSKEIYYFCELLTSGLSLIQGKAHKLDGLYMVRQTHLQQTSAMDRRQGDLFDWVANPNWPRYYARFRDCLAEELARQDEISVEEARKVVKQAFWLYLAKFLNHGQTNSCVCSRLRQAVRGISGVRRAWRSLRFLVSGGQRGTSLPALLRPSSPYHDDFLPIYMAITTPPTDLGVVLS